MKSKSKRSPLAFFDENSNFVATKKINISYNQENLPLQI